MPSVQLQQLSISQQFAEAAEKIQAISKEVKQIAILIVQDELKSDEYSQDDGEIVDAAVKEIIERNDIVRKYDKGLDQVVEDWENPNLELYKVTDRYGFMHEKNLDAVEDDRELFRKRKELQREKKWVTMLREWPKYENSPKLRSRIYKGIPDKFRAAFWGRLLGLDHFRLAGVYEQLKLRARLVSPDIKQIDVDVNRTYRNHYLYRHRYDQRQQSLFHVLAAYSMYNTEVGYCQGMSQVAALLLMYFEDEDAFWALHVLMYDKKYGLHGMFTPGFPKLLRYQKHHEKVLKKNLSSLKKHLDKCEFHPYLYSTKWFFQCFLDRVPFTLALRLWDVFILDGDCILTAMAYNIMKMHERRLMKSSFEEAADFLQAKLEKDFGYSDDEVMESLKECLDKLRRGKLLYPPPPEVNEGPLKPFGQILLKPLDEIARSVSVISPSSRHKDSRSTKSAPITPVGRPTNRSPTKSITKVESPNKVLPSPISKDEPGGPVRGQIVSRDRGEPLISKTDINIRSPLKELPNDVRIRSNNPRSPISPHAIEFTFGESPSRLRNTDSFYDNIPPVDYPLTTIDIPYGNDYKEAEEELRRHNDVNEFGGKRAVTEYTKVTRSITSTVREETVPSPLVNGYYEPRPRRSKLSSASSETSQHVIKGTPNNVTVVEIMPEGSGLPLRDENDYDEANYNDGSNNLLPYHYFGMPSPVVSSDSIHQTTINQPWATSSRIGPQTDLSLQNSSSSSYRISPARRHSPRQLNEDMLDSSAYTSRSSNSDRWDRSRDMRIGEISRGQFSPTKTFHSDIIESPVKMPAKFPAPTTNNFDGRVTLQQSSSSSNYPYGRGNVLQTSQPPYSGQISPGHRTTAV